ncbi:MAG: HAMP domain-containing protein [Planctomycetia bacterium]|nr:HAMP domain-containing protein [Planctomycetia bacterium]
MPFAHPREMFFGTLRFRLTMWNTAVVLVLVVVTLWGVREGLRLELWKEADVQLLEDAGEIKETIERNYLNDAAIEEEINRKATTHTHRGLHIRIFDENDALLMTSANAPPSPFSMEYFQFGMQPVTAGQFRLVHFQLTRPGMPAWKVRVGTSFAPLESDIEQVTRLLLVVGSVALLISPLGGYWLAGRATRPIAQIIDTTARLHPSSLDERLPMRGTRDELDRLSATINGFLDRIGRYLDQNREFTSNAAHELRSPLAAIQNSLEVALNADRTPEEYRELLDEILEECGGLRTLVNQLLLLAENDAGRLQAGTEPVQFDTVVQKAYDMFLGVAEAASIDLRIAGLERCRIVGDAARLRQVVNNLIDNAIKFTRSGGVVTIRLWSNPLDQTMRLAVRDTGSGIPAHDLPHIFNRFYRGDKSRLRDRPSRGTGLGLAICQSIVAAHGGRIEVDSVVDQGTTITVIIPAATALLEPDSTAQAQATVAQLP